MQDDQLKKAEAAPLFRDPGAAPLTTYVGGGPVDTLSHGQQDPVTGTHREAEIRHQERQMCAAELLILADQVGGTFSRADGDALRVAARMVGRREVTG